MFWQQFSGTNSIGYYAPEIFETIGVAKSSASLFATGVYGTVKVVTTAIFLFIGIDQLGRKKSLMFGGLWMSAMMFIIGAVLATHPPDADAAKTGSVSHASLAMVVMIYLFVIGYSSSWGPVPWVFVSEIFPTRLRAYGVGLAGEQCRSRSPRLDRCANAIPLTAATQWLFNFVITKVTPEAINSIGWRTFLMFAIFCLAMSIFAFFFIPETKRRTLEEMDVLFGTVDAETRAKDVEAAIIVEKKELEIERNEGEPVTVEHAAKQ